MSELGLFDAEAAEGARDDAPPPHAPLAARMRPRTLDEYVGQSHVLGPDSSLRQMIERDRVPNLILHGPPGTGKTSLARVIARSTSAAFESFNAVSEGVPRIRAIAKMAEHRARNGKRTILFVDEIHRLSRVQQDALLPLAEEHLVLIGATTEQPSFFVSNPLLSRSEVVHLRPLGDEDLRTLVERAVEHELGFKGLYTIQDGARRLIVEASEGDARRALTLLEQAAGGLYEGDAIEEAHVRRVIGEGIARYDRREQHYDMASAFQKSCRDSDVHAALYWAARMIDGGEDARFVFRRLQVIAAEDVGLADPQALVVVDAAASVYERLGAPEGHLPLAEAVLYVASAPKSNRSYAAWKAALAAAREEPNAPAPMHSRNAPTRDMAGQGYGKGYINPFDRRDHFAGLDHLPESRRGERYFEPSEFGHEKTIRARLQWWQERRGS